jgi:DNA-binding response OmpR family regulator
MENSTHPRNGILIINPPGELQISLQALLTSHLDQDVLVVSEVESAIKVIDSFKPTLIILDQNISKKDPATVISRLKNLWPSILCLVLANPEADLESILEAGADKVLVKGLRGFHLIEHIIDLLDNFSRLYPDHEINS